MKWLALAISACIIQAVQAQTQPEFIVYAAGKSIQIKLDDELNEARLLTIVLSSASHSNLLITVKNESSKEWKRSFFIDDSTGSTILEFVPTKSGNAFCIKQEKLQNTLSKGIVYHLYTVALPADKEKAMLVRVARKLIAKVELN